MIEFEKNYQFEEDEIYVITWQHPENKHIMTTSIGAISRTDRLNIILTSRFTWGVPDYLQVIRKKDIITVYHLGFAND